MRWNREDYIRLMTFGNVKRQMFVELFGPLIGLEEEWLASGAATDEISLAGFDFDFVPVIDCGGQTGLMGGVKPDILEDHPEYQIAVDEFGRKTKLCKGKGPSRYLWSILLPIWTAG